MIQAPLIGFPIPPPGSSIPLPPKSAGRRSKIVRIDYTDLRTDFHIARIFRSQRKPAGIALLKINSWGLNERFGLFSPTECQHPNSNEIQKL
jgi:hypothetical protein